MAFLKVIVGSNNFGACMGLPLRVGEIFIVYSCQPWGRASIDSLWHGKLWVRIRLLLKSQLVSCKLGIG